MKKIQKIILLAATILGTMLLGLTAFAAETINVNQGNIVTNNGTDCYRTLRTIMENNKGKTIVFPAGTYKINQSVRIYSNTTVEISGDAKFIRDTAQPFFKVDASESNVTITGGDYDGCGKGNNLINITGSNVRVSNMKFYNSGTNGLAVYGSNVTVKNCQAYDNAKIGLYFIGANGFQIYDCNVQNNKDTGIVCKATKGKKSTGTISRCTILNNGAKKMTHGVGVNESTVTFTNNTITGSYECGISVSNAGTVNIAGGNKINNNKHHGVGTDGKDTVNVYGEGNTFNNNVENGIGGGRSATLNVKDCEATGNKFGISINDKSAGTITNVKIVNNKKNGISVYKNSTATIIKCTVTGNGFNGIAVNDSKADITSCAVDNNAKDGIRYSGSVGTIKDVTANNNKTFGIVAAKGSSVSKSTMTIDSSTANSNKNSGIRVMNGSTVNLSKVTSSSNEKCGIYMDGGAIVTAKNKSVISSNKQCGIKATGSKTKFTGNGITLEKNKSNGIYVTKKATLALKNSTLVKNGPNGISFNGGGKMQYITGCTIKGHTKYGIYFGGAKKVKVSKNKFSGNGKNMK